MNFFVNRSRTTILMGCTALLAIAVLVVALKVQNSERRLFLSQLVWGKYPETRKAGLDPAAAKQIGTTDLGRTVGVVDGADIACVVFGDGTDSCKEPSEIAAGYGLTITNQCRGADPKMDIVALVPANVVSVRFTYNTGRVSTTDATNGVVVAGGDTPVDSSVGHPVSWAWLDKAGTVLADFQFPITTPSGYCPEPNAASTFGNKVPLVSPSGGRPDAPLAALRFNVLAASCARFALSFPR